MNEVLRGGRRIRSRVWFLFFLFAFGLVSFLLFSLAKRPTGFPQAVLTLGGGRFLLDVGRTPRERTRGLSGRESMAENGGMLFLFDRPEKHAFWMKDMRFPIDIFWLYGDTVVFIKENALPPVRGTADSQLPIFAPPEPADRVVETRAGIAAKLGIRVGQKASLLIP